MPLRLALALLVALSVALAGRPLIALQRALPPRQVAVDWLTATTMEDAVRHLPPATIDQFRALQKKAATPEQEMVVNIVEAMLAPLVFSQLRGGRLTTTGTPVSTITVGGPQALHLRILDVSTTGDAATVPLRVRETAEGREEAGAIELRRDGGVWRIVAANLGSTIPLARFDSPNYLDAATSLGIEQLRRDRVKDAAAVVIGRLRALISAQFVYAVHNGGFFAPPECLLDVAKCKTPFKLDSPPLAAGTLDLRGSTSRFYPGPQPSASEIALAKAGAQSLRAWAHVFSPTDTASQVPPMCGDSTGRVCRLPSGRTAITGGACPAACADVK